MLVTPRGSGTIGHFAVFATETPVIARADAPMPLLILRASDSFCLDLLQGILKLFKMAMSNYLFEQRELFSLSSQHRFVGEAT